MGVRSLAQEDPHGGGLATHSRILAWKIPWTEGPGRLQSIESQRAEHNWSDLACMRTDREEFRLMEWIHITMVQSVHGASEFLSQRKIGHETSPHVSYFLLHGSDIHQIGQSKSHDCSIFHGSREMQGSCGSHQARRAEASPEYSKWRVFNGEEAETIGKLEIRAGKPLPTISTVCCRKMDDSQH